MTWFYNAKLYIYDTSPDRTRPCHYIDLPNNTLRRLAITSLRHTKQSITMPYTHNTKQNTATQHLTLPSHSITRQNATKPNCAQPYRYYTKHHKTTRNKSGLDRYSTSPYRTLRDRNQLYRYFIALGSTRPDLT